MVVGAAGEVSFENVGRFCKSPPDLQNRATTARHFHSWWSVQPVTSPLKIGRRLTLMNADQNLVNLRNLLIFIHGVELALMSSP
jgi:hypothetical protein